MADENDKQQQPQADKPQADQPKADQPKADQPKAEKPQGDRPPREGRENRGGGQRQDQKGGGDRRGGGGGGRPDQRGGSGGGDRGDRGPRRDGGGGGGRPDHRGGPPEIDYDKLVNDSLYLDNQAHTVVVRLGVLDSGTKSQLRRLYGAVRRATRAPEKERQHEFVMLRARLAYTIARHGLRSLDQLERLLLQVTRKNDARGYERFRDLFEAIVAYNE